MMKVGRRTQLIQVAPMFAMDGAELLPLPESPEYRTPSPRRRYIVGQDSRDWSFSTSTPQVKCTGYEDVVRLLETVASATLGERTLTDTYEARIRELEAVNAELLKEKEGLLLLLNRDDRPPTAQATEALAQVQALRDALFSDREDFRTREANLTSRVWGLEEAVADSLRDLLKERRVREEIEWRIGRAKGRGDSTSMSMSVNTGSISNLRKRRDEFDDMECRVCKAREAEERKEGEVGEEMLKSMEAVTMELEMRNEEMKQTQSAAEEELELASRKIRQLRKDVKALSMLKSHKEDTESELDMLKDGMKRIERIAMMYGPLEDELGLLDAIESWKLEFLAVSKKRKKRKKKEEKHGLG